MNQKKMKKIRLIDANALMRDIARYHLSDGKFQHWVEVQPTVDAEPVRHGKWIQLMDYDIDNNAVFECSVCGGSDMHARGVDVPYCWHCGARMDEERKEE